MDGAKQQATAPTEGLTLRRQPDVACLGAVHGPQGFACLSASG